MIREINECKVHFTCDIVFANGALQCARCVYKLGVCCPCPLQDEPRNGFAMPHLPCHARPSIRTGTFLFPFALRFVSTGLLL